MATVGAHGLVTGVASGTSVVSALYLAVTGSTTVTAHGWAQMTTSGAPPSARWYMGAAYVPALGGTVFMGGTNDGSHAVDATVYFLSDAGAWSTLATTGPGPAKRWGGGFVFDGVDKLHLIGGYDLGGILGSFFNFPTPAAHWILDVNTLAWSDVTSGVVSIDCGVYSSACYGAADNLIAYWTGQGTTGPTDTVWLLAPPSTIWANHASGPSARNFASMAYDEVRGKFVFANGNAAGPSQPTDTWELASAAAAWVDVSGGVAGASLGGQGRCMCWSPTFGVMAFGGATAQVNRQQQFYDGATWTAPVDDAAGPSARQIASMVWSSGLGKFILFGGQDAGAVNLNDVWTYG